MKYKKTVALIVIFICLCLESNHAVVKAVNEKSFKKLVILPLENLGKKAKDTDSIGREIALSLTQSLAQIKELSVIDPHTVRTYFMQKLAFVQMSGSGDEESIKKELDKFEKLDIDLVLSGTYRIIGKEIKVIIQLIDITSGEVKITPVIMKEKYPDSLFYLEEIIAEKTAYSISTIFESYYGNFASFYKFTTNREAYRLYLAAIDAKSDQTIQGYARAMKYFYESYRMDNSFLLPFEEMDVLNNLVFKNIFRAAELLLVVGTDVPEKTFNAVSSFAKELTAKIKIPAHELKIKFEKTRPDEFKNALEIFSASPYKNRGKDIKSDIENFPNDIEILFHAWEKIDNFNPESRYRKKIIAINPDFIPLVVVDFFKDIKKQRDMDKKQIDKISQPVSEPGDTMPGKADNKASKKYNESLLLLKNKIDSFNKKNPVARYSTVYFQLFSDIYFVYYLEYLTFCAATGIDIVHKKETILHYCLSFYDNYIAVMEKEFRKI